VEPSSSTAKYPVVIFGILADGIGGVGLGIALMMALRKMLDPSTTIPDLSHTWRKHWTYGKWALGSSIVGWIPTYLYFSIVSIFAGIAHAGELRALMNLAGPVLPDLCGAPMLFLPYGLARTKQRKATPALTL